MTKENDATSAEEPFDPYAFAEAWYQNIWPVKYPIEFSRYVGALKTLGRWDTDEDQEDRAVLRSEVAPLE